MRLRVRKCQSASPGAPEHLPAVDPPSLAESLEIGDQVPGGVGRQVVALAGVRCAAAAAALVGEHDPVPFRVEQPPHPRRAATAWSAVQEHDGLAGGVATLLPVELLTVTCRQQTTRVRLDRRVERHDDRCAQSGMMWTAASSALAPAPSMPT